MVKVKPEAIIKMRKILSTLAFLLSCTGWLLAGPSGPPAGNPILNTHIFQKDAEMNITTATIRSVDIGTFTTIPSLPFGIRIDGAVYNSEGSTVYGIDAFKAFNNLSINNVLTLANEASQSPGALALTFDGDTETGIWTPAPGWFFINSSGHNAALFRDSIVTFYNDNREQLNIKNGYVDVVNRLAVSSATEALPSIYYRNDPNTGIHFPSSDNMAISAGGKNVAQFGTAGVSGSTITFSSATFLNVSATTGTFTGKLSGKGTSTNDSASAGYIGEYISSVTAGSTATPANGVFGDNLSIILTAGDWDINAIVSFTAGAGATVTSSYMGIGTVTGNDYTGLGTGDTAAYSSIPLASTRDGTTSIPQWRTSLATSKTYYLKVYGEYTGGALTYRGRISARRMR